jgi:hypothetical protein
MRIAALISLILMAWPLGAAAKPPVLVELFTAQGCGNCREAEAHLARLADRPGVLALMFSVDYWDYLGWTDTFARPEHALRQKAYVTRLKLREPYTPQVVVDGRQETQGQKTTEVDRLVRAAAGQARNYPDMRFVGARRVDVGSGRVAGAVGTWRGAPKAYRLPATTDDGLKTVVIVQTPRGGRVLGLAQGGH